MFTRTWKLCGAIRWPKIPPVGWRIPIWAGCSRPKEILADAELHYRTAIRLKPDDEDVYYNYGNMLVKAGRLDEAIPQYRQALQLSPADAETWNNLGVVLYQEHRTDRGHRLFSRGGSLPDRIFPTRISIWATRCSWSINWTRPSPNIGRPCGSHRIPPPSKTGCARWACLQTE